MDSRQSCPEPRKFPRKTESQPTAKVKTGPPLAPALLQLGASLMKQGNPGGRKPALLSLRSAFVLTLALLVALAAGGLLYAAHHSIAQAVLGAGGAFAATATFLNWVIELRRKAGHVLSTYNSECVKVAYSDDGLISVRDTKDPGG